MLVISKTQMQLLQEIPRKEFVERVLPHWLAYSEEHPIPGCVQTEEQIRQILSEVYLICDRNSVKEEMQFIRLAFFLLRAARVGQTYEFVQNLTQFYLRWIHSVSDYAIEWIDLTLQAQEEEAYYG